MRPTILVAESSGIASRAVEILSQVGELVLADLDRVQLLATVPTADVLWVRLRNRIDEEVIRHAPRLQAIASATTGLDHIDLGAAERAGIRVISLRGANDFLKDIRATAELTLGLMLSLLRQIPRATRGVEAGEWNRDAFKGREIYRKTVGIVGFGRLGRIVAGYLSALGARVVATDPRGVDDSAIEAMSLRDLLACSDVVTIHASLSDSTRGLIGRHELATMKPGALLINTSRGEIVDDAALLELLASGHLGGAALDVLRGENAGGVAELPLVAYARTHAELLITPHIGGCTYESMEATEVFIAARISEMFSNAEQSDE